MKSYCAKHQCVSHCLYPKHCGPNMNCPACMGPEIERLQERVRWLEAQLKTAMEFDSTVDTIDGEGGP